MESLKVDQVTSIGNPNWVCPLFFSVNSVSRDTDSAKNMLPYQIPLSLSSRHPPSLVAAKGLQIAEGMNPGSR